MPTDTLTPAETTPASKAKDRPAVDPKARPKTAAKPAKPAELPPYHVVLLYYNDHSHEYVMEMLKALFGYQPSMGYTLADRVDRQGRAVVFTTHRELAELKCEQIGSYGNDWRVATCKGSMSAIVRPADV